MKKRVLSLVLVLLLCLTLLPTAAFAADEKDGTQGIVITDSNMTETTWTDGKGGTATWDRSGQYLTLTNYNVDTGSNAAITLPTGANVILKGSNSLTSASSSGVVNTEGKKSTVYINFTGTGSISLTGEGKTPVFDKFESVEIRVMDSVNVTFSSSAKVFYNPDIIDYGSYIYDHSGELKLYDNGVLTLKGTAGNIRSVTVSDSSKMIVYGQAGGINTVNAEVSGSAEANAPESAMTEEVDLTQDPYTVGGETAQSLLFTKKIVYVAEVQSGDGTSSVKYETVKEALANASAGDTVKIISESNQISLPDEKVYADSAAEGITLDLNGRSIGGYALNVGGTGHSGKLTVMDSSGGNGMMGLTVRSGGEVIFNPGSTATSCSLLDVYGGTVKFYGGNKKDYT